jgi:hypothetical protein
VGHAELVTCFRAGLLGRYNSFTSDEIIQSDVLRTMLSLMRSLKHKSQLAGLHVIAGLALTSEVAARKLLTPQVLQASSQGAASPTASLGASLSINCIPYSSNYVAVHACMAPFMSARLEAQCIDRLHTL